MPDVDLALVLTRLDRLQSDVGTLRDELLVQGAMLIRVDRQVANIGPAMFDLLAELRAIHALLARLVDRVGKLEDMNEGKLP